MRDPLGRKRGRKVVKKTSTILHRHTIDPAT